MLKHLTLAVTLVSALPAFAQEATDHTGHMMGDTGPASIAFMEANDRMHQGMMMEYTGNADVDFMQQMRVHHVAAIAMSEIQLAHGRDEQALTLAEEIIAEQRREVAEIDAWLAARPR